MKSVDPEIGQRDRLIVAGFCDDAADEIDQATVDDLFLVPAVASQTAESLPADRMAGFEATARQAALAQIEDESRLWLDEETEKLDAYADDLEQAAELRVKELETEIKAAKKALRSNTAISLADKVREQRRIKNMQEEADELKMTTFKRKKDIRAEIDAKLDAIANALQAIPSITPIVTLRWTVNE
jgi:hypothetical protein